MSHSPAPRVSAGQLGSVRYEAHNMAAGAAASVPAAAPASAPRRPFTRQILVLLLVVLGIASHVLIHTHATQLTSRHTIVPAGATTAAAAAWDALAARGTAAKCATSAPLSVLLVHEHHFKPIGSDLRLLGIVRQLRSLGYTVSLLFRGRVPAEQRSPPTHELAELLGAEASGEVKLSSTERPPHPPAIYEYTDLDALSSLSRFGWFDVVLCPLWFWRDPMASAAELLMPTLALHAPAGRRPFVAILSDDAHS